MSDTAASPSRVKAAIGRAVRPLDGGRRSPVWLELITIAWLLWINDAINNLAPLRNAMADRDAADVLHLERVLHLDPEAAMDRWLSAHQGLASWISNYYDNAHFGVTLALVVILWVKAPGLYRPLRNTLVLVNVVGMAVFWLFPTAPPRLMDPRRYPDVVANTHAFGSWHSGTLATAANQLAAMPSLHIAWACWCAFAAGRLLRGRPWAAVVWAYPVLTGFAVLSTGNHWLLDVAAGAATFALSALMADRWQGWWTAREARRALEMSQPGGSAEISRH